MRVSAKKNSQNRAGKKHDRRNIFETRTPLLGYYLIVTDTKETEKNYFEGLKKAIPDEIRDRIVIRVEKSKTTYDLVEHTIELCGTTAQQRIPWIVFDRDQVKDFDGIINKAVKNGINAGWSNICFEIWMYAYFGEMPVIDSSVACCKRFEDKYEKVIGKKYQKNEDKIYSILNEYGDFKRAYSIAEKRLKAAINDGVKPSDAVSVTTVHHLVKEILDKIEMQ